MAVSLDDIHGVQCFPSYSRMDAIALRSTLDSLLVDPPPTDEWRRFRN